MEVRQGTAPATCRGNGGCCCGIGLQRHLQITLSGTCLNPSSVLQHAHSARAHTSKRMQVSFQPAAKEQMPSLCPTSYKQQHSALKVLDRLRVVTFCLINTVSLTFNMQHQI
eukprot:1159250-Pelagomonas_calceolata.AAC.8